MNDAFKFYNNEGTYFDSLEESYPKEALASRSEEELFKFIKQQFKNDADHSFMHEIKRYSNPSSWDICFNYSFKLDNLNLLLKGTLIETEDCLYLVVGKDNEIVESKKVKEFFTNDKNLKFYKDIFKDVYNEVDFNVELSFDLTLFIYALINEAINRKKKKCVFYFIHFKNDDNDYEVEKFNCLAMKNVLDSLKRERERNIHTKIGDENNIKFYFTYLELEDDILITYANEYFKYLPF